ncbi:DUF1464 family protein [Thermococcus peptonophilus]|uniref:DUF1464 family protein n=1 Tax=Thermococcus peptonophilus TaxID=53952 RepID=UPI000A73CFB5
MVKAVGIDSGTKSMDIFGFDDETGEIIIDASVDRNRVTENPGIIIELLREVQDEYGKIDAIVGPLRLWNSLKTCQGSHRCRDSSGDFHNGGRREEEAQDSWPQGTDAHDARS